MNAFDVALTEAGVPREITIYEGQPHAFVEDAEGIRSGGAQAEAWNQMLAFLNANLKSGSTFSNDRIAFDYQVPFAWKYYAMLAYEHAPGIARHFH